MERGRASTAAKDDPGDAAVALRLGGLAVAWGAGVAWQLQQPALLAPGPRVAGLALGVAALVLAWAARRRTAGWAAGLVALALLAAASTDQRAAWRLAAQLDPTLEGRDLVIVGTVATLPRQGPDGVRFAFAVDQARDAAGRPVALPPRLWLGWWRGWHDDTALDDPQAPLAAGQRWRFTVRLKRPHGTLNPQGFDRELWLFENGLGATGHVRSAGAHPARRLSGDAFMPVERARQALRDAIARQVPDPRLAGVVAALAIGDQAAIDREDWEVFRSTGVAHLVAISGLHITLLAWLAAAAIGRAWRCSATLCLGWPAPVAARWGGVGCALAYALLAGWGVPAQRTVLMLAVAALLAQAARDWPGPLVLLAAGLAVVGLDPWALLQPGFWLSFAAVGLLMLGNAEAATARSPSRLHAVGRVVRHGLRTQVVATLGLAPLTLLFFQQVSVVGFVANLVAIPLVTLVITPLALAGALWAPLWSLAALGVQGLLALLQPLAAWPAAALSVPAAPAWAQALGLLAAVVALLPWPWRLRGLALPLVLPLAWPLPPRPPPGTFELQAADVGQGGAVLVTTARHRLLYDAGPQYGREGDAGQRVLLPLLRATGPARLDALVVSHRDSDHAGGAASVMAALPVAVLHSSLEAGHALRDRAPVHRPCVAGEGWTWDGVHFDWLHPAADDLARAGPATRPNVLSCVLRIRGAQRSALLPGDVEAPQEAALLQRDRAAPAADVLLVAHHGSRSSSTDAWLDAVAPSLAIAQVGYRNRFGHPAPVVVDRFAARGIPLRRSDHCGAWTWRSDQPPEAGRCEREVRRRYWHWSPPPAAEAEP
ncbi:DNA internalization-related competence protein ComEC/Rec2 [Aquabacterium sp. J223]|uniref:DNA internalization-related competence protein ComEC/Rec2 n=1 Tax=Aquabacterium sp. J223 TaxID=2898431 RepID=UPI0021AD64DD|nr:DNA internalization-related competence protein ComEC/Rec2 [Aquabacterium sp. J223]UUX95162.1 DNA internalization-related competence protein ComEC/Rec2 [Aquabacterium sp. J223]